MRSLLAVLLLTSCARKPADYVRYVVAADGVWIVDGDTVTWLAADGARTTLAGGESVFSIATDAQAMYWEVKASSAC